MSAILAEKKHLFSCWDRLKGQIRDKIIILFLDFDGTLAPIVEKTGLAALPEETRKVLEKLSRSPCFRIAVVSGRMLADLKQKMNIPHITYVGNHGYEIEGPDINFRGLIPPSMNEAMGFIRENLNGKLASIPGVHIEDKGITLSLHYRSADPENFKLIKRIFNNTCKPYLKNNQITVKSGKMVFEIRPPVVWDKGKAVLWLLNKWKRVLGGDNVFPVCIGDDVTDEDAFKVLKGKGVTVRVGQERDTAAEYYLGNQEEINQLLSLFLESAA
ncbi:MAG: trehalose-phosphatase [Omnitrophica WOR_2 bacterium RIFCSPHIGHO2_01_FULL_48_9]|nr:MAG: trehalose-phosphatase [Omnitrophica WOR_2 bacterium RIFCSPHIGHO2_02_FULL_48_11]OGX33127.1 MAG: trehalose-phosphatase [Omnitrophica WOR_2 bacterium RIFCSPHIGHO2_01_FULL_48_9]